MNKLLWAVLLMLPGGLSLSAADAVDYERDVKPVLRARCFACHGALKQEANLRLDTAARVRAGGDSGPAVKVGEPASSLLIQRVSAEDEFERMPPEGEPLSETQIKQLVAWVRQGASGPENEQPEQDPRDHWAYRPPERPALPAPADHRWSANPIDALLHAEHARRSLQPVATAEPGLLLRRVYLDLIGLPPTREQLQAFLADPREDAYERVVEDLLNSPHYGERWGRHWMDVWRYTDWFGLGQQLRYSQKHIWHWRDWIVESLNADRGYDQMIREMLAADEIAPTDRDALRATGFLARNYFLFNRTTWLDDTIEHTAKAFLGLTMNCTKCHDHKYDPISQEDYYRLRAFFEPYQVRLDPLPGEIDLERDGLPRVFDAHPDAMTYVHIRGDEKNADTSRPIKPGIPAVLQYEPLKIEAVALPTEAHRPALQPFVLEDHLQAAEVEIEAARAALDSAADQLETARRLSTLEGTARSETPSLSEALIDDDFHQPHPDVWQVGDGQWRHESGHLLQKQTGAQRAYLRTQFDPPADFQARFRFKTLSGQQWKSVGVAFDVVGGREKLVYLSAVMPGSKLQIAYNTGGGHVYPPGAKQDRAVALNEPQEMSIAVRGTLVNVAMNGRHALAYRLPVEREKGRIDLITFDAEAEFLKFELRPLLPDVKLVDASAAGSGKSAPASVEEAQAAWELARRTLAAAELRPEALRTSHAADVAKCGEQTPSDLPDLVAAAARAARAYELAQAELAVARASLAVMTAEDDKKPQATKDLQQKEAARDQAAKALASPGESYTSLQASLKALEGPDESDASRRQPYPPLSTGRRTALARWITGRSNPLTARVAVNHIWLRHFGQPLVESVTDFGRRTPAPAQQAVLDWLAVELMDYGWRMKHLHRLIVTSRTYRLSSSTTDADPATAQADPQNDYYWCRRPQRMESQVIRDSLLQLAGALDTTLGGPTIDPQRDDANGRRSLYFTHSRDDRHKFLSMFDDADILACYRRSESVVPQQALTLANSKLALDMASRIAARLQTELVHDSDAHGATTPESDESRDDAFVIAAFELLLARSPSFSERQACREALHELTNTLQGQAARDADAKARADLVHAFLNHNDFITIR